MTEASAPVSSTASATVLNTGRPRCSVPPLPGVTPPTTLVPYSSICSAWKVPCVPVKPWTMTRVFLLIKTLMDVVLSWVPDSGASRLHPGYLARSPDGAKRNPGMKSSPPSGGRRRDGLLRAVVDVVGRRDRQAGVAQQRLAFLDVGALQAHDHRHLDVHFLDRRDDALGDHVAAHDAAEDV